MEELPMAQTEHHDASQSNTLLETFDIFVENKHCRIRVFNSDLTKCSESYDIVACSAFKGAYAPTPGTLIGALLSNLSISVAHLSHNPEINMQSLGCWLSTEISKKIHRIACIELLDWNIWLKLLYLGQQDNSISTLLKSTFLSLRHLLENASESGILIQNIAMPVLGAGNQGIDVEYIAPPLFNQCLNMFKMIGSLYTIDFYELSSSRAIKLCSILKSMLPQNKNVSSSIFISYSSKQMDRAHELRNTLLNNGLSVWIAPEGIPAGSNYLKEIPSAISNAKALVLMLTRDAMLSPWVRRETSSAIGAGKMTIPVQLKAFDLTDEFSFLLDGIQILPVWSYNEQEQDSIIISHIKEKLN